MIWGLSSAGRAPALQAGGQRFDPARLHHFLFNLFVDILASLRAAVWPCLTSKLVRIGADLTSERLVSVPTK